MNVNEIALRQLDLGLLLVFLHLHRLRKAGKVAEHMGLTHSSISHALKRLREAFGDPLFLRHPKGMEPTAVARALAPRIEAIVEQLDAALATPVLFDPATTTAHLRLGAYDNEMTTLIPGLLERLARQAPGLRVSVQGLGRDAARNALERGELDLALGFFWNLPRAFHEHPLYEETYRLVMRRNHPLADRPMDLEAYLSAEHLVVSPAGQLHGIIDQTLEAMGKQRQVRVALPQFLPALATLASTDLIAALPTHLVERQCARFDLISQTLPLEIRSFQVSAIAHARDAANPLVNWCLDLLAEIAAPNL